MKKSELRLHLFFWIGFAALLILLFSMTSLSSSSDYRDKIVILYATFSRVMWIIAGGHIIFYFNYFLVFPLKGKKRVVAMVICFALLLFLYGLYQNASLSQSSHFWRSILVLSFTGFLFFWIPFTILSLIIYLINRSRVQKEINKQILKQNEESELALLKAQLNPHFLFNTLNNIDTLIHVDEKEKASESLIRMSDMMRYTTYESSNEKVLLKQEIEYLQNFIELQLLRLSNKELVDFKFSGDIEDTSITPMLLIPFVENAFKHASDKKSPKAIKICLSVEYGILYFSCSNKIDESGSFSKDKKGGVGLANIERRLQLIYPDRYKLEIQKSEGNYIANLKINLNEPELHNH